MSISNARQSWLSSHSSHASNFQPDRPSANPPRTQTPVCDSQPADSATVVHEDNTEEEALKAHFKNLYKRSEAKHAALFRGHPIEDEDDIETDHVQNALPANEQISLESVAVEIPKKSTRVIDEDNYDDDEDEDDEPVLTVIESPPKNRSTNALSSPPRTISSPIPSDKSSTKTLEKDKDSESQEQPKTSEDARKQLEESKKATEEAVKRSFHTKFYTLENDRIAMLEQQRLDESETQIDAEMEHGRNSGSGNGANAETHLGTLSSANLGTASLTLKHLIARIDQKRELVKASDAELRTLMNEVRKNRSKWANEDQIGQEELYEAAEKVLNELKAMTEYSTPFLQRVNKREAPDYYNIIKHPMDFFNMTKKLKSTAYKSKAEFVADLELIWGNCLKYNADLGHALRRNANMMKKESEKLIPLIPDITIRSRAEVEAEERRRAGEDNAEESDDEPIMSSRGRKPGVKGASKTRGAPVGRAESTPGVENKPVIQVNGLRGSHLGSGSSDAGIDGSQSGFATPPIHGSVTPSGMNGALSHGDSMDLDGAPLNGSILNQALGAAVADSDEDEEYKLWKQVTKKDRARVAKERHKLFKGDRLNPDEPALLRTKAGMRRLLRQQKQAQASDATDDSEMGAAIKGSKDPVETLAEGMDGEEEVMLPDYYDPVNMIPDINPKLQWIEDADGQLIDPSDEFLRMVPKGYFTAPQGTMTAKIESNMKQMQETRKLCSKIGVIKQMQLQSQMYNNQFQKYCPEPFMEADIEPQTVAIEGAVMSSWTCHAALQRSVGKLCYHAGFEELQPSALDAITDLAADFFSKIAKSFSVYSEAPKVPATGTAAEKGQKWQAAFTNEEIALHTLSENGFDVESLDSYAKDDMDKLGSKLGVMHERMKAHLTDLLRPALQDAGPDGAGAFRDGSDQFIGGDFAEDLDEDFFGFKELGLMEEFGLSSLSVPLHLLQTKLHQGYQAQNPLAISATAATLEALPPFEPVTIHNIDNEIGLIHSFFKNKLQQMGTEVLIEDEDLPQKQRFPKPRLPPTGKITSPRKRPLKEQIGNAKKKKKLENGMAMEMRDGAAGNGNANSSQGSNIKGANGKEEKRDALTASAKKLKSALVNGSSGGGGGGGGGGGTLELERGDGSGGEKDDTGMMSPESLER